MWLWFNRKRFTTILLSSFISLNLFYFIVLNFAPVAPFFRLNLANANLRSKNLAQSKSLAWANLSGAVLENTDLRGADLGHALGLTLDQLAMAHHDAGTIFPDYINFQIALTIAQRNDSIQKGQYWSEQRSTDTETVIDVEADVVFGLNQADIPSEATTVLERLATRIQASGNGVVLLNGHTDSTGSDSWNQDLSERRAQAVKDWLAKNGGIDPERLRTKGYGSKDPIATNATPAGRQQNRRVEIRIPKTAK
jgi:outer membrane protein OmpA-like peptidoglycan-associated protein